MRLVLLIGLVSFVVFCVLKVILFGIEVAVGMVLILLFLIIVCFIYWVWFGLVCCSGCYTRDVVFVGVNIEVVCFMVFLNDYFDIGLWVVGVVGDCIVAVSNGLGVLWCGVVEVVGEVMVGKGVNGVIIVVGVLVIDELNECIRDL